MRLEEIVEIAHAQIGIWCGWKLLHCQEVARIGFEFATYLELPLEDRELVHAAGLLHDWGQLTSYDRALDYKPREQLTRYDMAQIRQHPKDAALLLHRLILDNPNLVDLIHAHHCKLPHGDGECGYPRDYCEKIIFLPRHWCLILADCYHAQVGERPYSRAVEPELALRSLLHESWQGALDRELTGKFCEFIAPGFLDRVGVRG